MLSLPSAKAIQAGATIVLVAITAWYAYQTKRSSDLFRRQLDLEERRKHADVLQERIDRWLDSFPEVKTTEIRQFEIASEGVDFAIPSWLRNDPYLEDLLENHVPELQNRIDRIQDKYSEFCGLRKKYIYDINSTNIQSDERSIEVLDEAYAEWLFDIAIKLQRGDKNKEEIKSNIEHSFSEKSPKKEDKFLLRPDPNQSKSIMEFYYKRSTAQRREDQSHRRLLAEFPKKCVEEIEDFSNYGDAMEAAQVLDEIEEDLDDLNKKLIEYKEMPRLPGDCDLQLGIDE